MKIFDEKFMTPIEYIKVELWTKKYLQPSKSKRVSAYSLKHMVQKFLNIYSSEGEFCELLKACGFKNEKNYETIFRVEIDKVIAEKYYI